MYIQRILNAKTCGDLFTNDPQKAKNEYRMMAKAIHPDICNEDKSDEAMKKLNLLYQQAVKCFDSHTWTGTNKIVFTDIFGKTISVKYKLKSDFELGVRYVCDLAVCYVFNKNAKAYADNAFNRIKALKYKDEKMKQQIKRFMPEVDIYSKLSDGRMILVIKKAKDLFPLDAVIDKCNDKIDARAAAWMISRLCNISCYLSVSDLSHNGLTMFNIFVSPQQHSISLLGGWWYAVPIGTKMIGTSKDVYRNMSTIVKTNKCGHQTTDFESIKHVGRILTRNKTVPDAINKWLNDGSPDSAIELYRRWDKSLEAAFGERKFVKLDITSKEIFDE